MKRSVLQELAAAGFDPGMRRLGQPGAEFLGQARFAQAALAGNQDQLALAVARAIPARQDLRQFVVASDQGRRLVPRHAVQAPAPARGPHHAVEHQRFGDALEALRALVLDDEQTGGGPLHRRRNQHPAGLRHRLHARRHIGHFAEDVGAVGQDDQTRMQADARRQRRLAFAGQLAVERRQPVLDRGETPRVATDISQDFDPSSTSGRM